MVKAAIKQGIYVIIDWHDHNADQHVEDYQKSSLRGERQEAAEFFGKMAKKCLCFISVEAAPPGHVFLGQAKGETLVLKSSRAQLGAECPKKEGLPRFGNVPNVIFEIFNEPIFQLWNETIKPYHERIVSVPLNFMS